MLPSRSTDAEDSFVATLRDADPAVVITAAIAAADAGRPLLAARLVGLVAEGTEGADAPQLERARRAARFLLLAPTDKRGPVIAELEEELAAMRARRLIRATNRQRKLAAGSRSKTPTRRKPRKTRT